MRIRHHDNQIDIEFVERTPGTSPLPEICLQVNIRSDGFSGQSRVWVANADFDAFIQGLTELERLRRGEATLRSLSPDELLLQIASVNAVGQMAVSGGLGRHVHGSDRRLHWHELKFGFEFDPGLLREILASVRSVAASAAE